MSSTTTTSIEDVVSAVTDLYQTLAELTYLPAAVILKPPAVDGWPLPSPLPPKSPAVLSLMKDLPYLSDARGFRWVIAPSDTSPINYSPSSAYDSLSDAEDPLCVISQGEAPYIPPSCLPLTNGDESGTWLILDTEPAEWTITLWNPSEAEELPEPMPSTTEWRRYLTEPAVEVLQKWERHFKELDWIPLRSGGGLEVLTLDKTGEGGRTKHEEVKSLYLEHGWPARFDAEGFKQALKGWLGEGLTVSDDEDDDDEEEQG